MKNKELLSQLQEAVSNFEKQKQLKEQEAIKRKEESNRLTARKKAEKTLKNVDKVMLQMAQQGDKFYVVSTLFKKEILSGDGSNIEEWPIDSQEVFKLLNERGYEPVIKKRNQDDPPTAYSLTECPYVIIVFWE